MYSTYKTGKTSSILFSLTLGVLLDTQILAFLYWAYWLTCKSLTESLCFFHKISKIKKCQFSILTTHLYPTAKISPSFFTLISYPQTIISACWQFQNILFWQKPISRLWLFLDLSIYNEATILAPVKTKYN